MDLFTNESVRVETGDVILLSGVYKESVMIQVATRCRYNHAGIAIWMKIKENYDVLSGNQGSIGVLDFVDNSEGSELFIFESSGGSSYDILTKKNKFGCRLVRLSDIMIFYDEISVRKVNVERNTLFYDRLKNFILLYKDVNYDTSPFNLIAAPLGISITENSEEVFCSELVAEYLYSIGALPIYRKEIYPPRHFVPKDFVEVSDKVPTGTFSGELQVFYRYSGDFLKRYGTLIILILFLIFLLIVRLSIE